MFVICDADNRLVRIDNVTLVGCMVAMYATFAEEQDALDVLFNLEQAGLLKGHTVKRMDGNIMLERA